MYPPNKPLPVRLNQHPMKAKPMIQLLLQALPAMLDKMFPFLPGFVRNLVLKEMEKEISKTTPEQLQALNHLIEQWMDAVGRRDFEEIGALFEQHHVAPGGVLEQVTARLMGLGFMPPTQEEKPIALKNGEAHINVDAFMRP